MAVAQNRFESDGNARTTATRGDASLRDLLRQLANDTSALVRGEIALARLEVTDGARQLALDAVKLVIAFGVAWLGALALTASLILGLGILLGAYWAAALLAGIVLLAVGGILAQRGMRGLKQHSVRPDHALRSIERDRHFAREEIRELRDGIRS